LLYVPQEKGPPKCYVWSAVTGVWAHVSTCKTACFESVIIIFMIIITSLNLLCVILIILILISWNNLYQSIGIVSWISKMCNIFKLEPWWVLPICLKDHFRETFYTYVYMYMQHVNIFPPFFSFPFSFPFPFPFFLPFTFPSSRSLIYFPTPGAGGEIYTPLIFIHLYLFIYYTVAA